MRLEFFESVNVIVITVLLIVINIFAISQSYEIKEIGKDDFLSSRNECLDVLTRTCT